MRQLLSLRM